MKAIKAIKAVGGAIIVLASINAFAQASGTDAAASDMSQQQSAKQQYKAVKKADRAQARKVRSALAKAKGISAANILVRSRDGNVTLEGSVPEQPQVDLATTVAQGVPGVKSVKNALTIRPVGQ
ncbi:MAG TPA: BON domain-containing protein [Paraburkholderia sp.]|jgi:hyperosmotically inducible protein|nr:BON domain-containing protein [Paraburkholderia sp.]